MRISGKSQCCLLVVATLAFTVGGNTSADGAIATVTYDGDPGEFVTQGQQEILGYNSLTGDDIVISQLFPIDGRPSTLDFNLVQNPGTRVGMQFSSQQLGVPLSAGQYEGAIRNPFPQMLPGFDFSVDSRGAGQYTADFTITELEYDSGGQLSQFDATFVADSENSGRLIRGSISFSSATAVPEASALGLLGALTCLGLLRFVAPAVMSPFAPQK